MAVLVQRLLSEGEPFVYAYYDGIDKVAHADGLGALYDAELRAVDRMVGDLLAALPDVHRVDVEVGVLLGLVHLMVQCHGPQRSPRRAGHTGGYGGPRQCVKASRVCGATSGACGCGCRSRIFTWRSRSSRNIPARSRLKPFLTTTLRTAVSVMFSGKV